MTNQITFDQLREFLEARERGKWHWFKNTRCKYVRFETDTRTHLVRIWDRDGIRISFETLMYQYSKQTPEPPSELEPEIALPFL